MKTQETRMEAGSYLEDVFRSIPKGKLILADFGDKKSLIWFESFESHTRGAGWTRVNRFCSVPSWNRRLNDGTRVTKVTTSCIYGTHRLDFIEDPEFGIFLPSSSDQDIFLETAYFLEDGSVVALEDPPNVVTDPVRIEEKIRSITRQRYFFEVVMPFIEARPTRFQVPRWQRSWFRRVNIRTLQGKYEKVTRGLARGSFVYTGCKEEVYLLGVAREKDGSLYMQGTYTPSTKPVLYFSNNYLGFISRYDAEKPKFEGDGFCNVAVYRTYDIPGFAGSPFVFPQVGRSQNCKNSIFTGEPEIITGDLKEALEHFRTTDFVEYIDLVNKYAGTIDYIHPAFTKHYEYFI